jgi:hypothetical protein
MTAPERTLAVTAQRNAALLKAKDINHLNATDIARLIEKARL